MNSTSVAVDSRPSYAIPATRYAERIEQAQRLLRDSDGAALLLGPGPDLRWLAGYAASDSERLTLLLVPPEGQPTLVAPSLELMAAREAPAATDGAIRLKGWGETDDPVALVADELRSGSEARDGALLVSDVLRASFLLRMQAALRGPWDVASVVMRQLRAVKDTEEIELLRRAAQAADRVIEAIASGRLIGRTEIDLAHEIRARLEDEGHDEAAFAIVGSGPYSASPHHDAGPREIGAGEALVLDIGGTIEGYGSDVTRTVWIAGPNGEAPDPEFAALYEVLQRSQQAATDAVRPGVPCERIDEIARTMISDAGYGEQFIHRTGHGIGLEGHEHPYLVAGNNEPLRERNAFSVEPGIYVEGRFGARIEDIVVCRADRADVLNRAPRELRVVAGG